MLAWMAGGVPGNSILVLLPQRTLAGPYREALSHPGVINGGIPSIQTMGGIARRMVDLFWPLISAPAGFARPDSPRFSSPWKPPSTLWLI